MAVRIDAKTNGRPAPAYASHDVIEDAENAALIKSLRDENQRLRAAVESAIVRLDRCCAGQAEPADVRDLLATALHYHDITTDELEGRGEE